MPKATEVSAAKVRQELRRIGTRRAAQREGDSKLRRDTKRALARAQGVIPMEEAVKLADVSRTTAYEYLGNDGKADASRKGRGAKEKRRGSRGNRKS